LKKVKGYFARRGRNGRPRGHLAGGPAGGEAGRGEIHPFFVGHERGGLAEKGERILARGVRHAVGAK